MEAEVIPNSTALGSRGILIGSHGSTFVCGSFALNQNAEDRYTTRRDNAIFIGILELSSANLLISDLERRANVSEATNVKKPSSLLPKITEELVASLPDNEIELLNLTGVSGLLCCLSVFNRERVAGRTCVSQIHADRIISLISSMGLHCHRSMFDLLPQSDLIGGNINHHSTYVLKGSQEGARAMLYLGIDAEFAKGAETAEITKQHQLVGRLFGYPECCVEFFIDNDGLNQDRTPNSIMDPGPFPSILNPIVAELYGISLSFHFACSPRCAKSLEIVRSRLKNLMQYSPSIAEIESLGSGIGLYGPSIGTALITQFSQVEPNTYVVGETVTSSNKAISLFSNSRRAARICLRAAHDFQIEDISFNDDSHFAAVFC